MIKLGNSSKYDFLFAFLNDHWDCHYNIDNRIYNFIYEKYPEYHYKGSSFRAVIVNPLDFSKEENTKKYKSWAKSEAGLINFIANEIKDEAYFKGDDCFILSSNIKGIDIAKIAIDLKKINMINQKQLELFIKEEEIVNMNSVDEYSKKRYSLDDILMILKSFSL